MQGAALKSRRFERARLPSCRHDRKKRRALKRFRVRSNHEFPFAHRSRHSLDQQQLQIARAALWHQTAEAALVTADAASAWLEDLGLCLFLPRHVQLPAPAPSFVEACLGAASVTPSAAALGQAAELAARLIDERRALPLNLLGAYSDQPDLLITPEVLPWVAALRGDRQWKNAPGGRASPLVVRVWQVLDQQGEANAVELCERLGRELTETAVLRALIELWTGVRAIPLPTPGLPTRWTLLKHRFPVQLTTAANTAQATALSALLSIYLRSAVAATAEECEVFLSPLTSRSRIREVLHGMMAARQFATMSVGPQTLLFVEGTLPETAAPELIEAPIETPAHPAPALTPRPPRQAPSFRDKGRPPAAPPRFAKPQRAKRPYRREEPRRDQRRQAATPSRFAKRGLDKHGPEYRRFNPSRQAQSGNERRPAAQFEKKPWQRRLGRDQRPAAPSTGRPGSKPWQRRGDSSFRDKPRSAGRPPRPWQKRRPDGREVRRDDNRSHDPLASSSPEARRPAGAREPRPWQKRTESPQKLGQRRSPPNRLPRDSRSGRPDRRPDRFAREARPGGAPGDKRPLNQRMSANPRKHSPPASGERRGSSFHPAATKRRTGGQTNGQGFKNKPGFSRTRPGKTAKKPFHASNSFPRKPKPRKNRSQEETPE